MKEEHPNPAATILLVEDNPRIAEMRSSLLRSYDCEVMVAHGLDEAKRLLAGGGLDLVITDINLSGRPGDMAGLEVAREARKELPDVPVVAYTAWYSVQEVPMHSHPEVDRVFAKGDQGLDDLEKTFGELVALAIQARDRRMR